MPMSALSFTTFNVNNLYVRYGFSDTYPGDRSSLSRDEREELAEATGWFLPGRAPFGRLTQRMRLSSPERRACIAKLLREPTGNAPEIAVFQEVESIDALRLLNQRLGLGYSESLVIDGNDPRNIDVGVLSKVPILDIRTHINEPAGNGFLFSRDCLEVEFDIGGSETMTLFVNHMKSKYAEFPSGATTAQKAAIRAAGHARRQLQAERVLELVKERFAGRMSTALFAVVGDFNDTAESPYLDALFGYSWMDDVIERHLPDPAQRWTHRWKGRNRLSQIDHVLVSRALRGRIDAVVAADETKRPHIERHGIGFKNFSVGGDPLPRTTTLIRYAEDEATPRPASAATDERIPFDVDRYAEVEAAPSSFVSDHCPVRVWF
jgi:endonuclease/exonuclease/phosphatase family metal-dependent hydrolase